MRRRHGTLARPSDSGRDLCLGARPHPIEGLDSKTSNLLHHPASGVVDDGYRHSVGSVADSKMAFDRSQDLTAPSQPQPVTVITPKTYWPTSFWGAEAPMECRLSSPRVRRAVTNCTPGDDANVDQDHDGHHSECCRKDVGTGLESGGEALRRRNNLPSRRRCKAATNGRKSECASDQRGHQTQPPKAQPLQFAIVDGAQTEARLRGDPPKTARNRRANHRLEGSLLASIAPAGARIAAPAHAQRGIAHVRNIYLPPVRDLAVA